MIKKQFLQVYLTSLCFSFIWQGCGNNEDRKEPLGSVDSLAAQQASQSLILSLGDSAFLIDGLSSVSFVTVLEESRCPIGAVCIWQGRVGVALRINHPDLGTKLLKLGLGEGLESSYDFDHFTIELLEVYPKPSLKTDASTDSYQIELSVTQTL